ncbi:MAG TPA: aldehyde dehydrogenase family protein [Candidatus Acidoferrales bacterium]|nr:aldehyde dehydrogenase family protein [Candidatus Acidoferrales bacterium]
MSLHDRDLISIQEARHLIEQASDAQKKFAGFSQAQVDAIADACAQAATAAAEPLARLAVEETGYGNVPDKIIKNLHASVDVFRAIRSMKTVGILREDREKGIVEVAAPVGVVAAIIPSTNPTSTAIYKTLIALKAQNAIVLSPHPSAIRCICEAVTILSRAAMKAGAPDGLIGCFQHPSAQGTQEMMRHRAVGVILATGGTGLVRAAYSSGRPAYGVGPGNVPSFIERTANVNKAVADSFAGKTFDYGTICSSEQAIVAEEAVREQVLGECGQQGAYFLEAEEIPKLGELVFRPGMNAPNPKIVGRPATVIADMAGIKVPSGTRVLIAKLEKVGREEPLSGEKLSPILAFYSVPNLAAGIELCTRLLQYGGLGHTISIHSQSEKAVREFGQAVPAFRVCVNTSAVHGSIGYSTNLFPAMTLGCGSPGGNITSDNIGPQHLMNIKRIAWESRAVEHRTIPADRRMIPESVPEVSLATSASAGQATENHSADAMPDRKTISRIVESVMSQRGVGRDATMPRATASVSSQTDERPSPAAAEGIGSVVQAVVAKAFAAPVAATAKLGETKTIEATAVASRSATETKTTEPKFPVAEFVSESDVKLALSRNQKIFIGPRTILTPSARDAGGANDVFVDTKSV